MKTCFTKTEASCDSTAAFSLVEVMVAVGLLAFIIVGLLAMFYQTQRAFRSSATQTDVLEAGRATMQMIRQDIQEIHAANFTEITNFFIRPAPGARTLSFPYPPKKTGAGALDTEFMDVSFLQKVNDDWTGVAYRIDGAGQGLGTLMRLENTVTPDTFEPYISGGNGLSNLNAGLHYSQPVDSSYHRVIDGVVHFNFVVYDTNGVVVLPDQNGSYIFTSNAIPAYLDVELGVLEPKTLEQFRARAGTGNAPAAEAFLIDRVERVHMFKQRIPIRTRL
jgi:type II secretory pathway pseudopilin PulG